ncbi:MAG TPA: FAD-binding oxidoreductase, partial [Chthonomonadaceae bacterium]|nr:FAD-binding oxidoreductase [Chthonomonadaceae bacterium]
MELPNLMAALEAAVGRENVRVGAVLPPGAATAHWEERALATVAPGSAEQVAGVVRAAEAAGAALIPFGGGTQLHTGYPPRPDRPFLLLHTARMSRLLDYQPDDMTVTCEPGMTLVALDKALEAHRQFLPLDPPLPDKATLGGLVSTNATGFWRPAYGAPRDLLIGLRAVMTGGEPVKGGGKVVKNVAGYDVCKLFTGAWGTLGILTELTFKVRPLPETERVLAWETPDLTTATCIALQMQAARLAATYLLATNEPQGRPRLVLGLQGTAARVEWQVLQFSRMAVEAGIGAPVVELTPDEIRDLRDRQARLAPDTAIAGRIACLPTALPDLMRALEAQPYCLLTAHCATGIISLAATIRVPSL